MEPPSSSKGVRGGSRNRAILGHGITGPFFDDTKKLMGRPTCWYLRYSAPKRNADGTLELAENGRPVIQRYRPFYETKSEAPAGIPRIREQNETTGSGQFIFNRQAADDYEGALKLAGGVAMLELAKCWRGPPHGTSSATRRR